MKSYHLLFFFTVYLLSIIAPRETMASECSGIVLFRLSSCCEQLAWKEGEDAILKESQILNMSVETSEAALDFSPMDNSRLMQATKAAQAAAAIIIFIPSETPLTAEIRIYDMATDSTGLWTWPITARENADDAMYGGIRGVDALKARLLQRGEAPAPNENAFDQEVSNEVPPVPDTCQNVPCVPPIKPPPAQRQTNADYRIVRYKVEKQTDKASPQAQKQKWQLMLNSGAGIGGTPGEGAFLGGMELGVGVLWRHWFNVKITATWLPLWGKVRDPSGDNDTISEINLVSVRGWLGLHHRYRRVAAEIFIGGGSFSVIGKGISGRNGVRMNDVTNVAYVGGGGAFKCHLSSSWSAVLTGRAGMSIPEVNLRHYGNSVARIGRPFWDGGLLIEVAFQ